MNRERIEDCFTFMVISDAVVHHKIQWINNILRDWRGECECEPNLIFITHSIGAYFAQSLLLRRSDILLKTKHVIHLMPFIRFDPPPMKKRLLSSAAHAQNYTIPLMTALTRVLTTVFPRNWIDSYLKQMGMDCNRGREIAIDVFTNPNMMRNHLVLGMQELRGEILPLQQYLLRHVSDENSLYVTRIYRRAARVFKCKPFRSGRLSLVVWSCGVRPMMFWVGET
jgi:hypothetical protein